MPVITDDYHAVNPALVAVVEKPDSDELWFLRVTVSGQPSVMTFASLGARDDFYKALVTAMG